MSVGLGHGQTHLPVSRNLPHVRKISIETVSMSAVGPKSHLVDPVRIPYLCSPSRPVQLLALTQLGPSTCKE